MAERIQRRRVKGWKKPDNTVAVSRGTRWGNPFIIGKTPFIHCHEDAVDMYEAWIESQLPTYDKETDKYHVPPTLAEIETLRGKNLMCFCPVDKVCHADVLLLLCNK